MPMLPIALRVIASVASGWVASDLFNEYNRSKQQSPDGAFFSLFNFNTVVKLAVLGVIFFFAYRFINQKK